MAKHVRANRFFNTSCEELLLNENDHQGIRNVRRFGGLEFKSATGLYNPIAFHKTAVKSNQPRLPVIVNRTVYDKVDKMRSEAQRPRVNIASCPRWKYRLTRFYFASEAHAEVLGRSWQKRASGARAKKHCPHNNARHTTGARKHNFLAIADISAMTWPALRTGFSYCGFDWQSTSRFSTIRNTHC